MRIILTAFGGASSTVDVEVFRGHGDTFLTTEIEA